MEGVLLRNLPFLAERLKDLIPSVLVLRFLWGSFAFHFDAPFEPSGITCFSFCLYLL